MCGTLLQRVLYYCYSFVISEWNFETLGLHLRILLPWRPIYKFVKLLKEPSYLLNAPNPICKIISWISLSRPERLIRNVISHSKTVFSKELKKVQKAIKRYGKQLPWYWYHKVNLQTFNQFKEFSTSWVHQWWCFNDILK